MSCGRSPRFRATTRTDPKTTLREFREYFASSYEALGKLAARIGVPRPTLADVAGQQPALVPIFVAKDQIATATRIRRVRLQRRQRQPQIFWSAAIGRIPQRKARLDSLRRSSASRRR
jgi:hypothetical protein